MHNRDSTFVPLRIPAEYSRFQSIYDDQEALKSLGAWQNNIHVALGALRDLVAQKRATSQIIDDTTLANIAFHILPFSIESGNDLVPWATESTQYIVSDILSIPQISQPSLVLLRQVLLKNLKPIFSSNPHPYLNTTTGRKLARPAGGPGATQDYYDEQTWKTYPGIWSVLAWVVKNIPPDSYEDLWPLIVPPTMTLLDDYQAQYKLEGVRIVSLMLRNIPKDILRRTSVDELIFTSLKTALSHLSDPETPTLLRLTISTWLALTLKVDEPKSFEFFDHLCTLVVNGIIEGIWIYSEENIVAMKATLDALPDVLQALDTATVSFLKSLIPQLAHILAIRSTPQLQKKPLNDVLELQKSAGKLLLVIIDVGACRMEGWKFTILDCVARCWVGLVDSGSGLDLELQGILRQIMSKLVTACPDISQNAYKALLMEDHSMFGGLVGVPPSPSS
ncbi:hypothetical protein P691DRAFT_792581 [Macrolepiota fuliginosa MF-IS2]|uniref:Uncharacterized protein n=1 Tax=Macrolepiota fuliginosa MF-IS2 TaxID=1400762 RepID=A0A9P5XBS7_9AGAR|nr:hypothetical protein P691DRAFT_792581 [Macrolepiota fuliginosa MF-IS2]